MRFNAFIEEYLTKFTDGTTPEPRDIVDVLDQQEIFDQLKDDLTEPDAVNIALEHEYTTFNMLSQGTQTLGKSNKADVLHCIASGHGERVTLVSPYQRIAVQAGFPTQFTNPETGESEDVHIPASFTFKDLSDARASEDPGET